MSDPMEEPMKDPELSRAILAYLAKGRSPFPRADETAVTELETDRDPVALLAQVKAIVAETLAVRIDWTTRSLGEGTEEAMSSVGKRHPELDDAALYALGWVFSYNWR